MSQNIEEARKQWPMESDNFVVGSKIVDSQKVWEPKTDFNAQYGSIQTTTWRSGHSVEIDNTPGFERIRVIHANGTYTEMQHDGTVIKRSNKHDYEVVVGDKNLRVKGGINVQVDGAANIKVAGSADIEVGGDLTGTVGGSWTMKVGGVIHFIASLFQIDADRVENNGINIGHDHVHKNVTPGPADTGTPEP